MPSILFVCTGNICRSPSAEALLRHALKGRHSEIDSAGTHGYHVGDRPDGRALELLRRKNVPTDGIFARKISDEDFDKFDHIIAMDDGHFDILNSKTSEDFKYKIQMFSDFFSRHTLKNVPDPYYGDMGDFEEIMDILEDGIKGMVSQLFEK